VVWRVEPACRWPAQPGEEDNPSIIFIDKIDTSLQQRTKGDHEVTGMMKAEFMALWDGLLSGTDRILVLNATNQPNDIDSAIMCYMPKRFGISLPNRE